MTLNRLHASAIAAVPFGQITEKGHRIMAHIGILRCVGILASALALVTLSQPAAAQSSRSYIQSQISELSRVNPGSAIVYAGCRVAADDEYYRTGSVDSALGTLAGCAGIGCAFTDSYQNCLSVNAQLFLLELRLS